MSAAASVFEIVVRAALVLVSGLTFLASYRVIVGPTNPDRVVALDVIGTNVVAIGALMALHTGKAYFILISLVLAIIGFMSTMTVSMYIEEGDIIE